LRTNISSNKTLFFSLKYLFKKNSLNIKTFIMAVTPNTTIVVQCKDDKIYLRANAIVVIPELEVTVKGLTVVKDPTDGVSRATLELSMSLDRFLGLLSKAHGGKPDARFCGCGSASREMDHDESFRLLVTMAPAPRIIEKSTEGSSGVDAALLALTRIGAVDEVIKEIGAGQVKRTFIFPRVDIEVPDGRYIVNVQTLMPTFRGESILFKVLRNGDLCHTPVLKILLAPKKTSTWNKSVLDHLFQFAELEAGGQKIDIIELGFNNALAVARGMWPERNNTPPKDPNVPWLITIPLMFSEGEYYRNSFLPLIAVSMHEFYYVLKYPNPELTKMATYALDLDYVYLDTKLRGTVATDYVHFHEMPSVETPVPSGPMDWTPKWDETIKQKPDTTTTCVMMKSVACEVDKKKPAEKHTKFPRVIATQHFVTFAEGVTDAEIMHIPLHFSHPTSGIMVTLSATKDGVIPPDDIYDLVCPVVAAYVTLNTRPCYHFDFVDLTEFNWLKVGLQPPKNNRTLLLPFSREMFSMTGECAPTCTVNLVLNQNTSKWCKWSVMTTSVAFNIRSTGTGMMAIV
jgi:hypothetical protein